MDASSLPPIGAVTHAALVTEGMSIDVTLDIAPLAPMPTPASAGHAYGERSFGCDTWLWAAELTVMALGGGQAEQHVSLPLHPMSTCGVSAATPRVLELGRYDLHVVQCVGHYATTADADAARTARSRSGTSGGASSSSAIVASEYPLLLLHVQLSLVEVSSRARDGADPALAALTTEGGASIDIGAAGYTGPLQPAGDGAKAKRTRARKKEAKELGDAIERMLGL